MAEKTGKKPTPQKTSPKAADETPPTAGEEETEAAETAAAESEAEAEAEETDQAAEAEKLGAEVADLKDKLLRALAESENVRRRAGRDVADTTRYVIANFARDMLSVADNLRRALDSIDAETGGNGEAPETDGVPGATGNDDGGEETEDDKQAEAANGAAGMDNLETLRVGVEMTERKLLNTLERFGVKPIEALGKKFDHNLHEALFELEDKDQPSGTVIMVMQTGYTLRDRLLRPAKVGVSKGGPKETPAEEAETAPESPADAAVTDSAVAYEKKSAATGSEIDEEL